MLSKLCECGCQKLAMWKSPVICVCPQESIAGLSICKLMMDELLGELSSVLNVMIFSFLLRGTVDFSSNSGVLRTCALSARGF